MVSVLRCTAVNRFLGSISNSPVSLSGLNSSNLFLQIFPIQKYGIVPGGLMSPFSSIVHFHSVPRLYRLISMRSPFRRLLQSSD